MPLTEEEKKLAEVLDLTNADTEKAEKMYEAQFLIVPAPPDEIGQPGTAVVCEVLSDELTEVTSEQYGTSKAIKVKDDNNVELVFPIGSKSARMQYFKLRKTHGSLVSKKLSICKINYLHDKWGKTIAYRIALVKAEEPKPEEASEPAGAGAG